MKDLSCTQELYLCVVNKKGKLAYSNAQQCLPVSGVFELINQGYVILNENNRLSVSKPLDDKLLYLKPIYERILALKVPDSPIAIINGKLINELLVSVGESLFKDGYTDPFESRRKTRYIPRQEAVTAVVEKIRAEFLENGNLTEETVRLAALLYRSNALKNYFSKFERKMFQQRLKEIKKSESYDPLKKVLDEVEAITAAILTIIILPTLIAPH